MVHVVLSLHNKIFDLKRHSWVSPAPYSPDLSPCDFFRFPKLKNVLKQRHFGTLENIQKGVMVMLNTIPVEDFQRCYQ
ncbi:DDE_3 domain-containing protein [Trichonephila clavipes]|nr:DDE_3 domain-containing protein [Trichonephila clavipes]